MTIQVMIGPLLYEIEETGLIRKRRGRGYLTLFPDKDGYLKVAVTDKEQKTHNAFVHRLVYEAFHGPIPEGMTVDHKDDNRLNNIPDNLQLLSPEENAIKGNARNWIVTAPDGTVHEVYNLAAFCNENELHAGHMYEVAKGYKNQTQCKGWTCYEHS